MAGPPVTGSLHASVSCAVAANPLPDPYYDHEDTLWGARCIRPRQKRSIAMSGGEREVMGDGGASNWDQVERGGESHRWTKIGVIGK